MLKPIREHTFISLRISSAMLFALCGIEAAGLAITGRGFRFWEFGYSIIIGAGCSMAFSVFIGIGFSYLRRSREFTAKFTSLTVSMGVVYLVLVLWLKSGAFPKGPGWLVLVVFLLLLAIMAGLGFAGFKHLDRGDPELAGSRFKSLALIVVISAGLYSVLMPRIGGADFRAAAVIGILIFFISGQYVLSRLLWGRRRRRLSRLALVFQLLIIVAVPLIGGGGAAYHRWQSSRPATAPAGSPNVILISIDTLRSDYVSVYPDCPIPTPALASLAQDGITFEHAISGSSWTPTGVATMITGLFPGANGSGELIPADESFDYTGPLPGARTLAAAFHDYGYATLASINNGWLLPSRGYGQGFDRYEMMGRKFNRPRFLVYQGWSMLSEQFREDEDVGAARQTDHAIKLLKSRPAGPFLFWVHYIDPHLPYSPHSKYPVRSRPGLMGDYFAKQPSSALIREKAFGFSGADRQFLRERYEGEVRFTDEHVGRLLDWLKTNGLYEGSLIALTSDHGEEFWEHGGFEHGHSFHREVIEVPLIIKLPGNRHAGVRVKPWVSMTRLGATLLDAVGISSAFPGKSLLPCLGDELACVDSETPGGLWFSQKTLYGSEKGASGDAAGKKIIFHADGSASCYDLSADPKAMRPLPEQLCRELRVGENLLLLDALKRFDEYNRKIYLSLGGDEALKSSVSKEERDALRDLGYFQ